jgi:hypothetical protein
MFAMMNTAGYVIRLRSDAVYRWILRFIIAEFFAPARSGLSSFFSMLVILLTAWQIPAYGSLFFCGDVPPLHGGIYV